jgi:hypothetical protein
MGAVYYLGNAPDDIATSGEWQPEFEDTNGDSFQSVLSGAINVRVLQLSY